MNKHTPGPWRYWTQKRTGGEDTCTFRNLDGAEVLRAVTVTLTEDDARLIVAAPELLAAQTMGRDLNTPDFLDWIADRLVHVYKESPNVDFILSLRERAEAGRAAIAKATGAA